MVLDDTRYQGNPCGAILQQGNDVEDLKRVVEISLKDEQSRLRFQSCLVPLSQLTFCLGESGPASLGEELRTAKQKFLPLAKYWPVVQQISPGKDLCASKLALQVRSGFVAICDNERSRCQRPKLFMSIGSKGVMSQNIRNVVILGSGPAGLTAAVYAARANLAPLLASGPLPGGQLTTTTHVENFPGFAEGILGPDLMEEMQKQAAKFGAEVVTKRATAVDLSAQPIKISFGEEIVLSRSLIIATGAQPKTLGLAREWELMGYGVSTCATCDGAFFRGKEIIVVGGGDSAAEESLFLTKFGSRVRLIHRRGELRASKIMAQRVLSNPKIEPVWHHTVIELIGDKQSGITGCVVQNVDSGAKTTLECSAIFYAIGHTPTSELFAGQLTLDANGYIVPKPNSTCD